MEHHKLVDEMISYFRGDAKRISHFMKVCVFAGIIGHKEKLDEKTMFILETAAIVHDIGIKPAEEKYKNAEGKLQEKEGPPEAEKMLERLGYEKEVTDRVSYLVGHHHTYTDIDSIDYQILVEADFLVNMHEEGMTKDEIANICERIFKTKSGKTLCREMFGLSD